MLVPSEGLPRSQMESVLVGEPIRNGARFTDSAHRELDEIARKYEVGRDADSARAHEPLRDSEGP